MLWVKNLMTSFVKLPDGLELKNLMIGSYLNYSGFKISAHKIAFSEQKDKNVTKTHAAWLDVINSRFHIAECYIFPTDFRFEIDYGYQIMECYVYDKPSMIDGTIIGKFAVMCDLKEGMVTVFLHK